MLKCSGGHGAHERHSNFTKIPATLGKIQIPGLKEHDSGENISHSMCVDILLRNDLKVKASLLKTISCVFVSGSLIQIELNQNCSFKPEMSLLNRHRLNVYG